MKIYRNERFYGYQNGSPVYYYKDDEDRIVPEVCVVRRSRIEANRVHPHKQASYFFQHLLNKPMTQKANLFDNSLVTAGVSVVLSLAFIAFGLYIWNKDSPGDASSLFSHEQVESNYD